MLKQLRSALILASIIFVMIAGNSYAAPTSETEMEQTETEQSVSAETSEDEYAQMVSEWLTKAGSSIRDNITDAIAYEAAARNRELFFGTIEYIHDLLDQITDETPWMVRVNKGTCTVTVYRVLDVDNIQRNSLEESESDGESLNLTSKLVLDSETQDQSAEEQDQASEGLTGEILIPVYACPCSVGVDGRTPSGTFSIQDHLRWHELIGPTWGQWCCHFAPSYLFHSLPYDRPNDPYSLQQDVYNHIGEAASHGCVRLTAIDAKYIYDHMPTGSRVEIFEGSEEDDPLGKPKRPGVGEWEHSYDPTDPELPENQ